MVWNSFIRNAYVIPEYNSKSGKENGEHQMSLLWYSSGLLNCTDNIRVYQLQMPLLKCRNSEAEYYYEIVPKCWNMNECHNVEFIIQRNKTVSSS